MTAASPVALTSATNVQKCDNKDQDKDEENVSVTQKTEKNENLDRPGNKDTETTIVTKEGQQPPSSQPPPQAMNTNETISKPNSIETFKNRKKPLPSDSLIVYVPLNVTADLGMVMRRVRSRRVKRIRSLYPQLFSSHTSNADNSLPSKNNGGNEDHLENEPTQKDGGEHHEGNGMEKKSDEKDQIVEDTVKTTSRKRPLSHENSSNKIPKRDQYGSVLDYLEAKYVRGVMIDDLDEKMRQKKREKERKRKSKMEKKRKRLDENNENEKGQEQNKIEQEEDIDNDEQEEENEELSLLSESEAGSCYSNDSGNFIDDSELHTEVVHQVVATSAYGATKIEAEAARRKKHVHEADGNTDDGGITSDEEDDAFFVNVGDLEMEDGWEENDLHEMKEELINKNNTKGSSKKKRQKNPSSSGKEIKSRKIQQTSAGKKEKTSTENKSDKKEKVSSGKKSGQKEKVSSENKTNRKNKDEVSSGSSQTSAMDASLSSQEMKLITKKKKIKKDSSASVTSNKSSKSKDPGDKKDSSNVDESKIKSEPTSSTTNVISKEDDERERKKARMIAAKKKSISAQKKTRSLYKKCIVEIQKMDEDNLPRKKYGKVKVEVTVPQTKSGGDFITFSNPHVPGQKLKVQIPKDRVAGGKFVVSVPKPEAKKSSTKNRNNKFSEECTELLDRYSAAFDEWCQCEAAYRTLIPPKKGKKLEPYKVRVEQLKKFDQMIDEFPDNLLYPIDAGSLRLVVRRSRQRTSKRLKLSTGNSITENVTSESKASFPKGEESGKKQESGGSNQNGMIAPKMGTTFPLKSFNSEDFVKED